LSKEKQSYLQQLTRKHLRKLENFLMNVLLSIKNRSKSLKPFMVELKGIEIFRSKVTGKPQGHEVPGHHLKLAPLPEVFLNPHSTLLLKPLSNFPESLIK